MLVLHLTHELAGRRETTSLKLKETSVFVQRRAKGHSISFESLANSESTRTKCDPIKYIWRNTKTKSQQMK